MPKTTTKTPEAAFFAGHWAHIALSSQMNSSRISVTNPGQMHRRVLRRTASAQQRWPPLASLTTAGDKPVGSVLLIKLLNYNFHLSLFNLQIKPRLARRLPLIRQTHTPVASSVRLARPTYSSLLTSAPNDKTSAEQALVDQLHLVR